MALPLLLQQLLISIPLLAVLLYVRLWRSRNPLRPMDWPVLGVLPSLISNFHNFHHELTVILAASGCNFKAQGPLGSCIRLFITSDPANVQHIFTTNHANYPKGEELAEIFEIVSGSILTVDGEAWLQYRAMFQSVLANPRVLELMSRCCHDKVVNGLLPFLTRMESAGTPFDMQDLMGRLIFDLAATPIFAVDPGCLSTSMPSMHVADAMETVMEVGLLRHTVPASLWKMMRWLNLGPERKLAIAHTLLHGFVTEMMENRMKARCSDPDVLAAVDIITSDPAFSSDKALLSKILINYMIAGRDTVATTLSWVFYNLAKNPRVVSGIREEMAHIASPKASAAVSSAARNMVFFESEETKDLVYLQAALFESLRLYPPGPFVRKTALADDVVPSGHQLCSGEVILVPIYSMGRMEALWGKDCHEYKPERWLSKDGGKLRYVPSHKFLAFNSGPRMCLGKDIAIRQMKTIVAAVIWNFDLELLEGQSIEPKMSCILNMKNGLKMKVKKREGHDLE